MSLFTTRYNKQPKFNPIVRRSLKDNDSIEVRVEGYDLVSLEMNTEQYLLFRGAVGGFKPSSEPTPPPPPAPPSDDWAS